MQTTISGNIALVGHRCSGSTTYLAALACYPNAASSQSYVQNVYALNEDTERLREKAKNAVEQQHLLEATQVYSISEFPDYFFGISLKKQSIWHNLLAKNFNVLSVTFKDYPGEFIEYILKENNSILREDYLEDIAQSHQMMLMFNGLFYERDEEYASMVNHLLTELNSFSALGDDQRRIAFVISMCDQPELWVSRKSPEKLAQVRFPKVSSTLKDHEQKRLGKVEYFAVSAYGMLDRNRPNSIRASNFSKSYVLKDSQKWKPFGLVAPIYWLCTGKRHEKLDNEL